MNNFNNSEVKDPKTDTIFRKLFMDFDTILTFINDVTGIGAVDIIRYHVQELFEYDRTSILDVSVKLSSGEIVDVEIQNSKQPYYLGRALYSASRLYGLQETDDTYTGLRKIISIHVVNHNMEFFDDNLLSLFRMTNTTGSRIIDKIDLYFINLKATNDNKQQVKDWKYLFNNYDKRDIFEGNRLQEIYYKLRDLSLFSYERTIYEQELRYIMCDNTMEELRRREEDLRRQEESICRAAIITIKNSMSLGKTLEDSINELELSGEIKQQVLRYFNGLQK